MGEAPQVRFSLIIIDDSLVSYVQSLSCLANKNVNMTVLPGHKNIGLNLKGGLEYVHHQYLNVSENTHTNALIMNLDSDVLLSKSFFSDMIDMKKKDPSDCAITGYRSLTYPTPYGVNYAFTISAYNLWISKVFDIASSKPWDTVFLQYHKANCNGLYPLRPQISWLYHMHSDEGINGNKLEVTEGFVWDDFNIELWSQERDSELQLSFCQRCKSGSPTDGGTEVRADGCHHFCSPNGYCGIGPNYNGFIHCSVYH